MEKKIIPTHYSGIIHLPASKSESQRVLLAAGLAKGTSLIRNVGQCSDEQAMLKIIQHLGAKVVTTDDGLEITGIKSVPTSVSINTKESGLATRLLSGVFAFSEGEQTIVGEGSIYRRKFAFYPKNKATFHNEMTYAADYKIPLTFKDEIQTTSFTVNGGESSQDISGILYGIAASKKKVSFEVIHLVSKPYLQMTLQTLAQFGLNIQHTDYKSFQVDASNGLAACNLTIDGDWSSASFWLVASALGKNIGITGIEHDSLQADKRILSLLTNANCTILQGNEIKIDGDNRQPMQADLTHCPDLFPALTTYAALTPGVSQLTGVHRLRNKESDRSEVLMEEFQKLGVKITIEQDTLVIVGNESIEGNVVVHSQDDHRIAMCLAIVGMFTKHPIIIENAECVSKSYPTFWEDLHRLKQSDLLL